MKVLFAGMLAAVLACGLAGKAAAQADFRAAEASNQLGFDLYQQLRASQEGNVVISPTSIATALAMTYAGAEGVTEREMAAVLHFDPAAPEAKLHADMAALQAGLQFSDENSGNQLTIANRLWGEQSYGFLEPFLAVTREQYQAELVPADFIGNFDGERQAINRWVEEQTHDRIQNPLPEDSLSIETRLVLVNTIYFLEDWSSPFDAENTATGDFHISDEASIEASLMNQSTHLRYAHLDEFAMLELPYATGDCSMLVLLPHETEGLEQLEAQLTTENLDRWSAELRPQRVDVTLPKFKTKRTVPLEKVLAALGMPSAFDPGGADFTGMHSPSELPLYIDGVYQQAFIEVDENGTEAAAATAVVGGSTGGPPESVEFRADHPFVFVIRDNATGSVLFLGRILDPTQ